jgi:hypothetical protein
MTRTTTAKITTGALALFLAAFALEAAAQDKPPASQAKPATPQATPQAVPQEKGMAQAAQDERPEGLEFGHKDKPGPPLIVAKGPCKKIGEKFEVGMKLYLTTDHRYIGEVSVYRPSHLFADGKSREAVKVKLADGKSTWLPADTARRIYVTQ